MSPVLQLVSYGYAGLQPREEFFSAYYAQVYELSYDFVVVLKKMAPRGSGTIGDYTHGFLYVEPFLHPCYEAYLMMVDDFSEVFFDLICQYFIE
ncbi:hypothetical protein H671_7g18785 [Cricetulus griseus]|uniref:Uncharacterized protein n=1 Tax=Cricetulus griseus TaxID=10029 RepID=A0A061I2D2_CRIGR|nr:hypothetical protein H671_7g18785 [Cricetulus griseus]